MKNKRKLLIIIGGKNPGHVRDGTYLSKLLKNFQSKIIKLPKFVGGTVDQYDIVIIFTSLESATRDQLDVLAEFLNLKNKYLILLHEACIYKRDHARFRESVGIRFQHHNKYGKFTVYCQPHCLTIGLGKKFSVEDELYFFDNLSKIFKDDEIFLFDRNLQPIGFERRFANNNSSLIFISLGHDGKTLANPNFQVIIKNINKLQFAN